MTTAYEEDIIVWANEQAALLRSGKLSAIDIEHIAEEIEDVGKSEKRELTSRMSVLLAHLLKWQFQPVYRGNSWVNTIKYQRQDIQDELVETPSLKILLKDDKWRRKAWRGAVAIAMKETGIDEFPESCIWTTEQILAEDFFPI